MGTEIKGYIHSFDGVKAEAFWKSNDEEAGPVWKGRGLCQERDGAES